jgi:hypothetical protein
MQKKYKLNIEMTLNNCNLNFLKMKKNRLNLRIVAAIVQIETEKFINESGALSLSKWMHPYRMLVLCVHNFSTERKSLTGLHKSQNNAYLIKY